MPPEPTPRQEATNQPLLFVTIKEYIDQAIRHERELYTKDMEAVYEKFATIEAARIIAKEEVEDARERMEVQAKTVAESTAKLVEARQRNEGSTSTKQWMAPSGTAVLAVIFAALAFITSLVHMFTSG